MKYSPNATPDLSLGNFSEVCRRISDIFAGANSFLIVSHIDPDGDALGSQLALGSYLGKIGKRVTMVRDSEIPVKYSWLNGVDGIIPASNLSSSQHFDVFVTLECPDPSRIGNAVRFLSSGHVINIDHHQGNTEYGTVNWIDPGASSVGEMLFLFLKEVGFVLPPDVCENLYTAILTDTGRFRYSGTTSQTFLAAAELVRGGADPRKITDLVYYNSPRTTVQLLSEVLCSLEYCHDGTVCALTLTRQMLESAGATSSESDGIVDFTLLATGVQAGALLKEVDATTTKVSIRTHSSVDASSIARQFGGGGHFNAAGCVVPLPVRAAREKIIELLKDAVDAVQ